MRKNKVAFYTSILALILPALSMADSEVSSSELKVDTAAKKTIKIEAERAVSINLGRSQISQLESGNQKLFNNENILGIGFQRFLSNRYSVNVNMNFAFNSEGEQSYYSGAVLGTYHRPIFNDKTVFRAAAGLSFSEYQFSGPLVSNSYKTSWLEGVGSLGIEFKIRKDLSILSSLDVRQAGFSSINNETVEGTSFMIQPIGLVFYY